MRQWGLFKTESVNVIIAQNLYLRVIKKMKIIVAQCWLIISAENKNNCHHDSEANS